MMMILLHTKIKALIIWQFLGSVYGKGFQKVKTNFRPFQGQQVISKKLKQQNLKRNDEISQTIISPRFICSKNSSSYFYAMNNWFWIKGPWSFYSSTQLSMAYRCTQGIPCFE